MPFSAQGIFVFERVDVARFPDSERSVGPGRGSFRDVLGHCPPNCFGPGDLFPPCQRVDLAEEISGYIYDGAHGDII